MTEEEKQAAELEKKERHRAYMREYMRRRRAGEGPQCRRRVRIEELRTMEGIEQVLRLTLAEVFNSSHDRLAKARVIATLAGKIAELKQINTKIEDLEGRLEVVERRLMFKKTS